MAIDPTFTLKADLAAFATKLNLDVSKVRRKIALDLLRMIAEATPVKEGILRGNWFLGDGEIPTNVNAAAPGNMQGNVLNQSSNPFATSWIVNHLPYARRVEFGWSPKAPAGMVRISIAEIEAKLGATTVLP